MQAKDIDVILITSPHNFRYFTGLDSYFWESPTRPWFLLIPQSNDPIAIIPSIRGRAWVTGTHQLTLDSDDPWPEGYRLTDTWPMKR